MIRIVSSLTRTLALSVALLGMPAIAPAQEVTVRVGNAPSIASGALLIAIERGYFREVGIKVVIDPLDSAANAIALLAQNQYQVIEGGIAAGYFNALERNLPITVAMSRVSTPLGHNMMLRADLKDQIKDIKQLKGRVIATNGPGSVSTYEIGKMLETAGLTMADVDVKVIPFAQYAIAFTNKAIDAALAIHPFTSQLGHAVRGFRRVDRPAPYHHLGQHDQYRLGQAQPRRCAQLLLRRAARRPRLLSGVSRRRRPQGHDRPSGQEWDRAAAGNAPSVYLAGPRPERPCGGGQHARHAGLVRAQQVRRHPGASDARARFELY
jgi:NMT1/THI5 like